MIYFYALDWIKKRTVEEAKIKVETSAKPPDSTPIGITGGGSKICVRIQTL